MRKAYLVIQSNYSKLKKVLRRLIGHPIIYNANKVIESDYKKRALLIYLVKPFLLKDDDPRFFEHQNLKRCKQIVAVLDEFGYVIDVADVEDMRFNPSRDYNLIISHRVNLNGIESLFRDDAVKIYFSTGMNHIIYNKNLQMRYKSLFKRRKYSLKIQRLNPESMPYLLNADVIIGNGNEFTISTWKEIFKGPVYKINNFGFRTTKFQLKDFSIAKMNFLFFASSGQVGKGLDLLLEIFPKHSNLNLYICSNFEYELDFCKCYYDELYKTPNVHPIGWIRINSPKFYNLMQKCAYVILPTCSEGQAGSVIHCMHAGLIPVVTKEAGVDTGDFGVTFANDGLEQIEKTILELSELPKEWHREYSIKTREIAKKEFSEDAFICRLSQTLNEILKDKK